MNSNYKTRFYGRLLFMSVVFLIPLILLVYLDKNSSYSGFVNSMISGYIAVVFFLIIYILLFWLVVKIISLF